MSAHDDSLRQELLEYLFGCHANPAEIEARLESDAALRGLLEEVRREAALLEEAARDEAPTLSLIPPSSEPVARAPRTRGPWRAARIAAAILLPLVALGPLVPWGLAASRRARIEDESLRLVLAGPPGVPDGASARFTVETWDLEGNARPAEVTWRVLDGEGVELGSHFVKSDGAFDLDVAASLPGARRVEVEATTEHGTERAALDLSPTAAAPLAHLSTDKPAYRPGETAFLRAVLLDRLSLRPRDGTYRLQVENAKGVEVVDLTQSTEEGVAAATFEVPSDAAGGEWALVLRDANDEFSVARESFLVRRYEPPQLMKDVRLDRKTYAPGETGTGELTVSRVEGGVPAGARVDASLVIDGAERWSQALVLDAEGRAYLRFEVPEDVERGDARILARITDGGVVETAVEPFLVPTGALNVAFHPEGGDLVAGVPQRVYVETTDPLGRPVDAVGRLLDAEGRTLAPFETRHQGRGWIELTPETDSPLWLTLDEPAHEPVPLPDTLAEGIALRALDASTPAGEPLALEVHTPHAGPWMLGVFCRGALVGQEPFAGAGRHELTVDLDPGAAGVLRATVFDSSLLPLAERLTHRESGRAIEVAVEPAKGSVAPGDSQELRLVATDEQGRPAQVALGVTVTDRAVREVFGDDHRIGLADRTWLVADVEELEDAGEFLAGSAESRRNVDLLLGTRGWRRFAWVDPQALVAERGDEAKRLLVREGRPMVPAVVDTRGESEALLAAAVRDERTAKRRMQQAYAIGVIGIAAALVFALAWWLLGKFTGRAHRPHWVLRGVGSLAAVGILAVGGAGLLFRAVESSDAMKAQVARALFDGPYLDPGDAVPPGLAVDEHGEIEAWRYVQDFDLELEHGIVLDPQAQVRFAAEAPVGLAGIPAPPGGGGPEAPRVKAAEEFQADAPFDNGRFERKALLKNKDYYGRYAYVREYAHQRAPEAGPRSDFAETVYWNALLRTGEDGTASLAFDTSDRVTTWEVLVDAHGVTGGTGRVGQARGSFEARLPFRLEAFLPVEVTRGDLLRLPVALIAEAGGPSAGRVEVQANGPFAFVDGSARDVALVEGRGRALIDLSVTDDRDAGTLTLAAEAGRWRDEVRRDLRVVPRGYPRRLSRGGKVTDAAEFVVPYPGEHEPGTMVATLKLYPSPLAGLQDGMEGLIRTPGGCFEQASRSNYPNVMALAYLEAAGATDAPGIALRARDALDRGYALLTGYECSEKGYEWFGSNPGHEALTAYGLLQFHDMGKVYEVAPEMVARTTAWLLDRRDGDGGFERNSKALDSFGRAPQEVTDAYISYALVATGTEPENVTRELDRVQGRSLESDDPYEVALCALALEHGERFAAADAARDRLKELRTTSGGLVGTTKSITSSGGSDLAVETTSLGILAWLQDPDDDAYVERALEFLLEHRQGSGTFGTTQATILALKALTAHAEANRRIANAGTLRVLVNGELAHELSFGAGEKGALSVPYLAEHFRAGDNLVRLELSGDNEFPWSFDLAYTSDQPADDPDAAALIETSLPAAVVEEGRSVALTVRVSNRTDEGQPMTLAIVGIPAGLEVPTEVLEDLEEAGRFDLWEIDGRELALYWRDLAPREVHEVVLDCLARIPGRTTGPASRAYLYYTPDATRWAEPLTVEVTPAE